MNTKATIAQCIIPRLDVNKYFDDENYKSDILKLCEAGIGGFCIFNGTMKKVIELTASLRNQSKIPLIFCADFENGLPMRLEDGTSFPHAFSFGKLNDISKTKKMAEAIALEAKSIGINWNFAPVCDINSNKKNPIINIRSFGETSELVSSNSAAYIKGTQNLKIAATAKHFPGHGDTETDSHISLPTININKDILFSRELQPFIKAIENDVKSIMLGHIAVPAIDDSGLPASLSSKIIKDLLINELNYNGLIITDAFDMLSIADNFSMLDASVLAFNAGVNCILLPLEPLELIENLTEKVSNDNKLLNKINKSSEKILELKDWCGITKNSTQKTTLKVNLPEHAAIALEFAFDALEKKNEDLVPIPENKSVAGIAVLQDDNIENPAKFFNFLSQTIENDCDFAFIDDTISEKEIQDLLEAIKDSDIILFCLFFKSKAFQNKIAPETDLNKLIQRLSENKKVICLNFGNPYISENIEADNLLFTYSDSIASMAAAAMLLGGRQP